MKIDPKLDLVLERHIDVSPDLVWKAWTEPERVKKWFAPAPWRTIHCEIDLRPGGVFHTVMQSPEGEKFPNDGCYLEIVPNRKLVWTDALQGDFRPAPPGGHSCPGGEPFRMTAVLLFEPHGKGTKYTAIALHSDAAGRTEHEKMGFHEGWGKALDQLVEVTQREGGKR
jgi:uncharacterized protein YndB with AHSA1/START domain